MLLGSVGSARAGLGGTATTPTSVSDSALSISATVRATTRTTVASMPAYDRTETTTADGLSVREFARRDGTVFAVAFDGPTMPDLKALLGTHYDSYVAAATARRGSHHVVSFANDGAVMTILKLPRGFSGHAHLPAAVPEGVDPETLK